MIFYRGCPGGANYKIRSLAYGYPGRRVRGPDGTGGSYIVYGQVRGPDRTRRRGSPRPPHIPARIGWPVEILACRLRVSDDRQRGHREEAEGRHGDLIA